MKDNVKVEFSEILNAARELNASDIHLEVGYPAHVRVQGDLTNYVMKPISLEYIQEIVGILLEDKQAEFNERTNLDFSFRENVGDVSQRYRGNVAFSSTGPYITLRLIPSEIKPVNELGFPNETWKKLVELRRGLVLVTGITGSGKSTTLASIINEINLTRKERIITLEDPIEYVYPSGKSLISQRELGKSLNSFGDGVKYALRQDPDVILVGEIRDRDTAEHALEASATGHLVFSTLHTRSTAESILRYVSLYEVGEQNKVRDALATNLSYILSQQLIPYRKDVGRTLAMEILNVQDSPAVQNKIRRSEDHQIQNDLQSGLKLGMITMDDHLKRLVKCGGISEEDAIMYSFHPEQMKQDLII